MQHDLLCPWLVLNRRHTRHRCSNRGHGAHAVAEGLTIYVAALQTILGQFFGGQLRFFRQLCTAAKVDTIADMALKTLQEGKCVVIGLQSTGGFQDSGAWAPPQNFRILPCSPHCCCGLLPVAMTPRL